MSILPSIAQDSDLSDFGIGAVVISTVNLLLDLRHLLDYFCVGRHPRIVIRAPETIPHRVRIAANAS